jgi:hypothetical protein
MHTSHEYNPGNVMMWSSTKISRSGEAQKIYTKLSSKNTKKPNKELTFLDLEQLLISARHELEKSKRGEE